jgi:hypothetical protein
MKDFFSKFNITNSNCNSISCNNGTITINGKQIQANGNISIVNGKVFVNGKELEDKDMTFNSNSIVNIKVEGDVQEINCNGSVEVVGNVGGTIDCGGSVQISGDVNGSIDCGGSVQIQGKHEGEIDAGGSVIIK